MVMKRSVVTSLILSIITCGIYSLYWFVVLTNETNELAEDHDTSGGAALLLTIVTCGIYGLYWAYKRGEKIDMAKAKKGIPASNGGVLYLILYMFGGIVAYALIQNEINNLTEA